MYRLDRHLLAVAHEQMVVRADLQPVSRPQDASKGVSKGAKGPPGTKGTFTGAPPGGKGTFSGPPPGASGPPPGLEPAYPRQG